MRNWSRIWSYEISDRFVNMDFFQFFSAGTRVSFFFFLFLLKTFPRISVGTAKSVFRWMCVCVCVCVCVCARQLCWTNCQFLIVTNFNISGSKSYARKPKIPVETIWKLEVRQFCDKHSTDLFDFGDIIDVINAWELTKFKFSISFHSKIYS